MKPLILASASPRRQALLGRLGLPFVVVPSDVDETVAPGTPPAVEARDLALRKAGVVAARYPGHAVIGADTVVALEGESLGKPRDAAAALVMLRRLRGRWHAVSTGLAVVHGDRVRHDVVTARVRMHEVADGALADYVASGEPLDKAGAYAIQGAGGLLIAEVRGSELAVVGLPLRRLAELLGECGVAVPVAPASIVERW